MFTDYSTIHLKLFDSNTLHAKSSYFILERDWLFMNIFLTLVDSVFTFLLIHCFVKLAEGGFQFVILLFQLHHSGQ